MTQEKSILLFQGWRCLRWSSERWLRKWWDLVTGRNNYIVLLWEFPACIWPDISEEWTCPDSYMYWSGSGRSKTSTPRLCFWGCVCITEWYKMPSSQGSTFLSMWVFVTHHKLQQGKIGRLLWYNMTLSKKLLSQVVLPWLCCRCSYTHGHMVLCYQQKKAR